MEPSQPEMPDQPFTLLLKKAQIRFSLHRQFLIVCSICKRVRDDLGRWHEIDTRTIDIRFGQFSHGLCPQCMQRFYGEYDEDQNL